ncbi:Nuclear transcription factor Y subunit C-2 [Terramyces sp. JEL0728]|nr:Nuclear transcription factor Y subunit C-2 [Terramyces sp. JEL0728]
MSLNEDEQETPNVQELMQAFWHSQYEKVQSEPIDFKFHQLPLARIKKVMKSDEDVKSMMISAESPILFSKACEMFILELTLRSWIHTEENKRRTLQKSDVSTAISKSDQYDFLIDIVPREETKKDQATAFPFFPPAGFGVTPEALLAYQQMQFENQRFFSQDREGNGESSGQ